jgi:gliding motility-associated-like protein
LIYVVKEIVESSNGCIDSLTQPIEVYPLPTIDVAINDADGCAPYAVDLTNNSSIASGSISTTTWNWGDGNTSTGATPAHTYTNTGTFTITVKAESDRGCEDSLTLTPDITVNARPVADFIYTPLDPSVLEGEVDLIDQSSADVIDWEWIIQDGSSYASQNATHNFQDSGLYNVELFVENGFGCRDSINKRIYVNADLFIHIPTSFTPNGDFLNEEFGLFGLTQGVVDMEMMIFNRWGEKVFESYSAENRWDGKYKGVDCQQGVYVYRIRFTNPNRTEWFYYNGNIELLR